MLMLLADFTVYSIDSCNDYIDDLMELLAIKGSRISHTWLSQVVELVVE